MTQAPLLSPAQRAFIEAAEAAGATTPSYAKEIGELPRLSSGELDELVQAGLVREAAEWRYYVFQARRAAGASVASAAAAPAGEARGTAWTRTRLFKTLLFWLIVFLIPVLLVQLTAHG